MKRKKMIKLLMANGIPRNKAVFYANMCGAEMPHRYMAERKAWILENLVGKTCYGGLDLSTTTDLTAFVLIFPPQGGAGSPWLIISVSAPLGG